MEFKSREEAAFWQLVVLSLVQSSVGTEVDTFADGVLEHYRQRMISLNEEESKREAEKKKEVKDLIEQLKGIPPKGSSEGLLSLVPPKKDPSSDPTN